MINREKTVIGRKHSHSSRTTGRRETHLKKEKSKKREEKAKKCEKISKKRCRRDIEVNHRK